jgi:diadenosine tetraphosphate (Ap4A) HIT family hydrolase
MVILNNIYVPIYGLLLVDKMAGSVKLTTHIHLMPRRRMTGATHPLLCHCVKQE